RHLTRSTLLRRAVTVWPKSPANARTLAHSAKRGPRGLCHVGRERADCVWLRSFVAAMVGWGWQSPVFAPTWEAPAAGMGLTSLPLPVEIRRIPDSIASSVARRECRRADFLGVNEGPTCTLAPHVSIRSWTAKRR